MTFPSDELLAKAARPVVYPLNRDECLALVARVQQLETAATEVLRECVPPVETLCMVYGDGVFISPTSLAGLLAGRDTLRALARALATTNASAVVSEEGPA